MEQAIREKLGQRALRNEIFWSDNLSIFNDHELLGTYPPSSRYNLCFISVGRDLETVHFFSVVVYFVGCPNGSLPPSTSFSLRSLERAKKTGTWICHVIQCANVSPDLLLSTSTTPNKSTNDIQTTAQSWLIPPKPRQNRSLKFLKPRKATK